VLLAWEPADLAEVFEGARARLAICTFSAELLESESSELLTTGFLVGLVVVFPICFFVVLVFNFD